MARRPLGGSLSLRETPGQLCGLEKLFGASFDKAGNHPFWVNYPFKSSFYSHETRHGEFVDAWRILGLMAG